MSSGGDSNLHQKNLNSRNPNDPLIFEFGDFRLDATHRVLFQNGEVVPLTRKQVETLAAIVERRGEVVGKSELMDQLWPGVAVEEANLTQNIYVLRRALGNLSDGRPVIETFRGRGYRFNGEINVRRPDDIELLIAKRTRTVNVSDVPLKSIVSRRSRFIVPVVTGAAVLTVVAAFLIGRFYTGASTGDTGAAARTEPRMLRLTPDINIGDLELSPDGRYLAFNRNEEAKSALWLRDLNSGSVSQLMPVVDGGYGDLSFAPDGSALYYTRFLKTAPNGTYFRVPSSGGTPVEVAHNAVSRATFSPDGKRMAFLTLGPNENATLVLANADGGDLRTLSAPANGSIFWYTAWGSNLSWSPDGRSIAVCGGVTENGVGRHRILQVSADDGSWQVIKSPDWNYIEDVAWISDQTALVVSARETEAAPFQLWRLAYPSGEARRLTNDFVEYDDITLSADSRILVARQDLSNMHLWMTAIDGSGESRRLTSGTTAFDGYYGIEFTSEGNVVYTSAREGNVDLWITDPANGAEGRQLTSNSGDFNGRPRLTSDGRYLVFVSSRSGSRHIWRMDTDGGNPIQLTFDGSTDFPVPGGDPSSIFFILDTNGKKCVAKLAINGGTAECVASPANPQFLSHASPDGKMIVVGTYDDTQRQPYMIVVASLDDGSQVWKATEPLAGLTGWTADSKAVIAVRPKDRSNLWAFPIDGSEPRKLTAFDDGVIRMFAVSPDRSRAVVARGNPSAEAVLITGF